MSNLIKKSWTVSSVQIPHRKLHMVNFIINFYSYFFSFSGTPQILATQTTLEFTPTQGPNSMSANSTQVRPKQFMSSLVSGGFNSTQFKINQVQDKSFGQPMHPPSEVIADPQGVGGGPLRVGRRFGRTPGDFSHRQAAFERSKSVFGRLHQKKMSRLQYQEKMRRGERQAKIALTRSYRAGDLPDIKINSADLVSCLRNLCYRDSHTAVSVARMLLSGMYILLP